MRVREVSELSEEIKDLKEQLWRSHDIDYYGEAQLLEYEKADAYRASFHLVAEDDDGRVVGSMSGWVSERVGFFSELIISPEAQGQGIGMAVFEAAEQLCADRGVTRLALRTDPQWDAFQLYVRRDWHVEFYIDDWVDGRRYVQMRKDMTANHDRMADVAQWHQLGQSIVREFEFDDFVAALGFVNRVGELAEQTQHHPDIDIRYNSVRLSLTTHSAGGLTDADFDLAIQIDNLV
jgi:4a-hydroxytetrahydrobiopterin dehydratase